MRRYGIWFGVSIVAGLMMSAAVARAADEEKDKKISPKNVPQRVMHSVNGRFPHAEITGVEKENENGGIVYDFELKQNGRKYEMDIKEDGTITEIEKEVKAKDVPAVTRAVKAKYPEAAIKEVMEVNVVTGKKEKPDHYEVTIGTGGKSKEVVVSLDGKSVKEEAEEKSEENPKQ